MLEILFGSILSYVILQSAVEAEAYEPGLIIHTDQIHYLSDINGTVQLRENFIVEPLIEQKYRNVVRQAFDYSCGSAALTTVLQHYVGRRFEERQVMEGLLHYGESDRIVERRGFSLLDMKRLVTALGYPSGGFRAELEDLIELDHPAIVPIVAAGFKHFVVVRGTYKGRVFIADPAQGNLSYTFDRFKEVWDQNVLFVVFPGNAKPIDGLELREEDLRFIDDQTISYLAFQEFPHFQTRFLENRIDNLLERAKNNPDGTVNNTNKLLNFRRN